MIDSATVSIGNSYNAAIIAGNTDMSHWTASIAGYSNYGVDLSSCYFVDLLDQYGTLSTTGGGTPPKEVNQWELAEKLSTDPWTFTAGYYPKLTYQKSLDKDVYLKPARCEGDSLILSPYIEWDFMDGTSVTPGAVTTSLTTTEVLTAVYDYPFYFTEHVSASAIWKDGDIEIDLDAVTENLFGDDISYSVGTIVPASTVTEARPMSAEISGTTLIVENDVTTDTLVPDTYTLTIDLTVGELKKSETVDITIGRREFTSKEFTIGTDDKDFMYYSENSEEMKMPITSEIWDVDNDKDGFPDLYTIIYIPNFSGKEWRTTWKMETTDMAEAYYVPIGCVATSNYLIAKRNNFNETLTADTPYTFPKDMGGIQNGTTTDGCTYTPEVAFYVREAGTYTYTAQ